MEIVKDKNMTISEAAEQADVHHITVRRWVKKGWIKAAQNRRTKEWTIDKDSLDYLLTEGPPEVPYKN